jgi:hypothetical protein
MQTSRGRLDLKKYLNLAADGYAGKALANRIYMIMVGEGFRSSQLQAFRQ